MMVLQTVNINFYYQFSNGLKGLKVAGTEDVFYFLFYVLHGRI